MVLVFSAPAAAAAAAALSPPAVLRAASAGTKASNMVRIPSLAPPEARAWWCEIWVEIDTRSGDAFATIKLDGVTTSIQRCRPAVCSGGAKLSAG